MRLRDAERELMAQFKAGALGELNGKVVISKSYDTKDWDPVVGKANMEKAITAIGLNNIAGVYSANDGLAGAVIDALKPLGVDFINMPLTPMRVWQAIQEAQA